MICSLSGQEVVEGVVSPYGHLFEKSLIHKYLAQNTTCPVTNEPLSVEQLIPIKINKAVQPRPVGAASVPGLLQILQNEWDAGVLESFTLKKQLDTVRQELAHSLYQYDASCRVIARLIKERDEARKALEEYKLSRPAGADQMDVDAKDFSEELKAKFSETAELLSQRREHRDTSSVSMEELKQYGERESYSLHQSSAPGVLSVDIHQVDTSKVATGGVDHNVILFDNQQKKKVATLSGHSKPVTHVQFHPELAVVLSGSQDKTVRVWGKESETHYKTLASFSHSQEVSSLNVHPINDYFISTAGSHWYFHSLHSGNTLATVTDASNATPITAGAIHPDNLLLATGQGNGLLNMWDIKNKTMALAFGDHKLAVRQIQCSENGYQLISATENEISLWDLREFKAPVHRVTFNKDFQLQNMHLNHAATVLAAAGSSGVKLYDAASFAEIVQLHAHSDVVTGVKFSPASDFLVSTSYDRSLKFYAKQ